MAASESSGSHLIHKVQGKLLTLDHPFQGLQLGRPQPHVGLAKAGLAGHAHQLPLERQPRNLPAGCRHHVALGLPHQAALQHQNLFILGFPYMQVLPMY